MIALAAAFTLAQCLEHADANAPSLQAASARARQAQAQVQTARSSVLPAFGVQLGLARSYTGDTERIITSVVDIDLAQRKPIYEQSLQRVPGRDRNDFSLSARLTQPLWDGGRSWSSIRRAQAIHGASVAEEQEGRLELHMEVVSAFYALARTEAQGAVLHESVTFAEQHLARAEGLFTGGRGALAEVAAARVNLGNARIDLARHQAQLEQARVGLNLTMGRGPRAQVEIALHPLDAHSDAVPDVARLGEQAMERSSRLAGLRAELDAAREELVAARAGWWPQLAASASYDRFNNDAARFLGKLDQDWEVRLGVGLQYDVYSGGATVASVRQAQERVEAAQQAVRDAKLRVAGEVERAASAVRALHAARALAAENVAAAEEGLRLADERYRAGAGVELEVRDAAQRRAQARLVELYAHYDLLIAQAELRRAAGEEPAP